MAAVESYSTLKTAITDWLARSNLSSFTDNFVQTFESRFYRQPKNWGPWMEATFTGTIASSVIPVPTDYLGMKYAYVNSSPSSRLDYVSLNQLYGRYPRGDATGWPAWMSRDVTNFVFGPAPDSGYEIKGVYWAKPEPIRDDPDDAVDHWLILNASDLLLYGSLIAAEPFMKNDVRLAVWQSLYAEALEDYRDGIKREDRTLVQDVLA